MELATRLSANAAAKKTTKAKKVIKPV